MKIGKLNLESNIFLAPMAGITDASFRAICSEFGYGLGYTEMISAKALMYNDKKTKTLMTKIDEEPYPAIQIFGSDLEAIKYAVEYINETETPLIDINMGCPAPKIVKNGEGSALMKNLAKASKIIKTAVKESEIPITVKIRSGFDKDNINAVEFALMAQESGVAAVAVHPRTRDMFYSGRADWSIIADVKNQLKIPVIGSGDIFKAEDAYRMLVETGCDAVMIARGVLGNPWIFKNCRRIKKNLETRETQLQEKIDMIEKHLMLMVKYKGERRAVLEMRKHAAWYAKGERNALKFKKLAFGCSTIQEIINASKKLLEP